MGDEKRRLYRVVIDLESPTDTLAVEAASATVEYARARGVLVAGARVTDAGSTFGGPLDVPGAPPLARR